jgi:hypothetical protein
VIPREVKRPKKPIQKIQLLSSGRQARHHEVYNPLQSWSPRNCGAIAGEALFDRAAASDVAGLRHMPFL